ncbi:chemotaxis protein CheW [uncultured Desulfovibrio sp.]|uniref:chemotaxis protein CheW n=1 Tax=uncultured Desulfovibrio sp. TaxID=167968 RepID=UPI00262B7A6E|nr:chemotaxis protein CheW [uncultured Desulfovibrio sp.]
MSQLIRDLQDAECDSSLLQLVTFRIGEEEFGVDILAVQEIIRLVPITPVPRAPVDIAGVINLRGKVIPVVNMRSRFSLPARDASPQTRIVVMESEEKIVGFLVDAVSEVLRIPVTTVEDPPPVVAGIGSEYIRGVGKLAERLLILLDLDRLMAHLDTDA